MTKFAIRNNMAYTSQMQFEVLRQGPVGSASPSRHGIQMAILGKGGA